MKADLKLFRYSHPDKTIEYSLQVKIGDSHCGSMAWADKLSWQQVIGLIMAGIPCEEVKVKEEESTE
jgi:hypothetical protein